MRKLLVSAAAFVLAGLGAAAAADLPVRTLAPSLPPLPVFTWTGFYLGTHTGGISLDGDITTRGNAANTIANVAANRRPASLSSEESALLSGIQAGYNIQLGSLVLGIEGDLSLPDIKSKDFFVSTVGDLSYFRRELDVFGTLRGRVGVAFDQVMIYATGGLAGGDITQKAAFFRNTDLAFQFVGQKSDTEFGYAVGGGVEFVLPAALQRFAVIGNLLGASAFTVKAEYLYFDLGDRDVIVNAVPGIGVNSYTSNFETTGHIGRIGFNYRFGTY